MFGIKTVITPQNALKMTYFCSSWPTLCWILLKLHSFYIAMGFECHRFLWISFSVLAISIVFSIMANRHRRAQMLIMEQAKEKQKIDRQDYEQSMDNVRLIRTKEKHLEKYDNLFLDLINAPGPFQLSEKKSHSFSTMPRKAFRGSAGILGNCNSTSQQTVNLLMTTKAAVLKALKETSTQNAALQTKNYEGKNGFRAPIEPRLGNTIGSKVGNTVASKAGNNIASKAGNTVPSKSGNNIASRLGNTIGPKSGNTTVPRSPYTLGPKAGTAIGLKGAHAYCFKPGPSVAPRSNSNAGDKYGRSKKTPIWRN